jgi:hypothetical protein
MEMQDGDLMLLHKVIMETLKLITVVAMMVGMVVLQPVKLNDNSF